MLRDAGEDGVTNAEMSKVSLRYGGHINELYRKGYKIKKFNLDGGLFRYILISEPANIIYFKNANDETIEDIEKMFGNEVSDGLKNYLDEKHFHVVRKKDWYLQEQYFENHYTHQ